MIFCGWKSINQWINWLNENWRKIWSKCTYNSLTCNTEIWTWQCPWCVCPDLAGLWNTFHHWIVAHFIIVGQSNRHVGWIIIWTWFDFKFIPFTANNGRGNRLAWFWVDTTVGEAKAWFCFTTTFIDWISLTFLLFCIGFNVSCIIILID